MNNLKMPNVKKISNKIVNNRILDLYLKYMGVKLLTTSTMVPLALILSKDIFKKVVKGLISNKKGGKIPKIPEKIPLLDDPKLISWYLKLTGISALSLSPYTLVPLGVLMLLYDKLVANQKGGQVEDEK